MKSKKPFTVPFWATIDAVVVYVIIAAAILFAHALTKLIK
jgi:hypothetical protein